MAPDATQSRASTSALQAVVAVLLTLVVAAAGPLVRSHPGEAQPALRLVECSFQHAHAIRQAVLPQDWAAVQSAPALPAAAPVQLLLAADRAQWHAALPPPARA